MGSQRTYSFGPFEVRPERRELRRGGAPLHLAPKDFGVLLALVARHGELVTREELLETVWPGVVVEDCNLARHVANLRRALGDEAERPAFIETVPRRGYRFVAPVQEGEAAPVEAAIAPVPPGPGPDPRPAPAGGERSRSRLRWLGLAVAAALATLALRPVASRFGWAGRVDAAGALPSVVILPVANLSGDPAKDALAKALAGALADRLERSGAVQVVPQAATVQSAAEAGSGRDAADELGADLHVEAAYLGGEGPDRLVVELVETRSRLPLWAEVFEAEAGCPERLQEAVAAALLDQLRGAPAGAAHRDTSVACEAMGGGPR